MKLFDAKDGQQVCTSNGITIRVLRIKGRLKLGVEAPNDVRVWREKALQDKKLGVKSTATTK